MARPFRCSGPMPTGKHLKQYQAHQRRAMELMNELAWPICMGLVSEAKGLVKKLDEELNKMHKEINK